jgi:hypothetical protein
VPRNFLAQIHQSRAAVKLVAESIADHATALVAVEIEAPSAMEIGKRRQAIVPSCDSEHDVNARTSKSWHTDQGFNLVQRFDMKLRIGTFLLPTKVSAAR